jgi:hypothetical protein
VEQALETGAVVEEAAVCQSQFAATLLLLPKALLPQEVAVLVLVAQELAQAVE